MDRQTFAHLRALNIAKAMDTLKSALFDKAPVKPAVLFAAAHVLLRATESQPSPLHSMEDYIRSCPEPEGRIPFLRDTLGHCWEKLKSLSTKLSPEELRAILLFSEPIGVRSEQESIPEGILHLVLPLLNIREGDRIAGFGAGQFPFLRDACLTSPGGSLFGLYTDPIQREIASLRAEVLGDAIQIEMSGIGDLSRYEGAFDGAFSAHPFGAELPQSEALDRLKEQLALPGNVSADWLWNAAVFRSIAEPGRAVCLMSNGGTWNTPDRAARQSLIRAGRVEAVIALPERLFEHTNTAAVLVVFSRGNTGVMMVDARTLCKKGRRLNTITEEQGVQIASFCERESEFSRRIPLGEIEENESILNPVRYFSRQTVSHGIPFGSVIKSITRGAPLKASTLDELVSEQETDCQYLMLKNIRDGILDDRLPYLKELDPRMEKYCIHDQNLILSKNGSPFKAAIVSVPEGKHLLANGNLFVIALDREKVDPYFVLAFLESAPGKTALDSIAVGAAIPTIGIDQVKQIQIPDLPLEKQREIGRSYAAKLNLMKIMRGKLEAITDSLKHIMDEYI